MASPAFKMNPTPTDWTDEIVYPKLEAEAEAEAASLVHLNKFASIDDEERGKYIRRKRVSFVRFRPKPFFPHISVSQLSSPQRTTGLRTASPGRKRIKNDQGHGGYCYVVV